MAIYIIALGSGLGFLARGSLIREGGLFDLDRELRKENRDVLKVMLIAIFC